MRAVTAQHDERRFGISELVCCPMTKKEYGDKERKCFVIAETCSAMQRSFVVRYPQPRSDEDLGSEESATRPGY